MNADNLSDKKYMFISPFLLIIFNSLGATQKVVDRLWEIKQKYLYVIGYYALANETYLTKQTESDFEEIFSRCHF